MRLVVFWKKNEGVVILKVVCKDSIAVPRSLLIMLFVALYNLCLKVSRHLQMHKLLLIYNE